MFSMARFLVDIWGHLHIPQRIVGGGAKPTKAAKQQTEHCVNDGSSSEPVWAKGRRRAGLCGMGLFGLYCLQNPVRFTPFLPLRVFARSETVIDTNLYSRQIGTFGMETMGKLIQMKASLPSAWTVAAVAHGFR